MMLEPKEDSEGEKFINLRRPTKKLFGDEVTFFSPPEITGAFKVHYEIKDAEGNWVANPDADDRQDFAFMTAKNAEKEAAKQIKKDGHPL